MKGVRIGLEVHVQITSLRTKLFCPCPSDYRGRPPNVNVCPVCLGLPGSLPRLNKRAILEAIKVALALGSKVNRRITWARKHYFYPDLPKGYQISQYDGRGVSTFATGGGLEVRVGGRAKVIRIRRINIEEDPARIVHPEGGDGYVLLDFNRSGIALLEIVTEPDIESPEEAVAFLNKLRSVLEHLGVTDPSLEGAMRVDVNVSLEGGERVEVKNIGGLKDVELAIRYEITRQRDLLSKGIRVERETRHWDAEAKVTRSARRKEHEEDYMYMPEPNLPAFLIGDEDLEAAKASMPMLPDERKAVYVREHGLSDYLAEVLVSSKTLADYYDEVSRLSGVRGERLAGLVVSDLLGWVPEKDPRRLREVFDPSKVAELIKLLERGEITIKMAKEMVPLMARGEDPRDIVKRMGWTVLKDEEYLERVVEEVIAERPEVLDDVARNPKAIQFVIGRALEKTGKRADPRLLASVARRKVEELLAKRTND